MADWQLYALIFSFLAAVIVHLNHIFKTDGLKLVFLRTPALVLTALPLFIFFPVPQDPSLYMWAMLSGVLISLADIRLFNVAAHHGARLANLYQPFKIFLVFILWLLVDPQSLQDILQHPIKALGIFFCFFLISFSISSLRKHDTSWKAFLAVIPIGIFFGFEEIIVKIALNGISELGSAIMFAAVGFGFSGVLSGIWLFWKHKNQSPLRDMFSVRDILGSSLSGFLTLVAMTFLNLSFALTPHPAYVSAIIILSILWLSIYYRLVRHEKNNLWSGLLMMAAAIGLLLLTAE